MKIKYDGSWLFSWRTDSFKEVLKVDLNNIKLLGAPIEAFSKISIVTVLSTGYVYPHTTSHGIHISLVRFYKHDTDNYAVTAVTKHE